MSGLLLGPPSLVKLFLGFFRIKWEVLMSTLAAYLTLYATLVHQGKGTVVFSGWGESSKFFSSEFFNEGV